MLYCCRKPWRIITIIEIHFTILFIQLMISSLCQITLLFIKLFTYCSEFIGSSGFIMR